MNSTAFITSLLLILSFSSCSKSEQQSTSDLTIGSVSKNINQQQFDEINTLNQKLNNNSKYQLTKDEYFALVEQGLLSEDEKKKLAQLFK